MEAKICGVHRSVDLVIDECTEVRRNTCNSGTDVTLCTVTVIKIRDLKTETSIFFAQLNFIGP